MADSSKDIQLRELKDMINDLRKMIKTLQATVDTANKREETLTQERDNLKEEVALLRKKLFGASSEKRNLDIPGQLNFSMKQKWNRIQQLQKQKNWKHVFRKKLQRNEKQGPRTQNVLRVFQLKKVSGSFRGRKILSCLRHSAERDRRGICPAGTGLHPGKAESI